MRRIANHAVIAALALTGAFALVGCSTGDSASGSPEIQAIIDACQLGGTGVEADGKTLSLSTIPGGGVDAEGVTCAAVEAGAGREFIIELIELARTEGSVDGAWPVGTAEVVSHEGYVVVDLSLVAP